MDLLKAGVALAPRVKSISADVVARHIQRGVIVRATWLALVSGRPAFFLGPPGVDKTGTVQSLAARIEGAVVYDALMPTIVSVEQLLVESTSIEELPTAAGGKAIRTRDTLGRAALAHVLFADEIWKADARVLQTVLDLAKGDGVRHEGTMVKTPLLAFLAASNELPDSEGNLGAVWSRMTIRVQVKPLDKAGKTQLVKARLGRSAQTSGNGTQQTPPAKLTLADVETLRAARKAVEVPEEIVETVLDVLQQLVDENPGAFDWAWADDRRFGRVFDVLQAHALLEGRTRVVKSDLTVLEWLLWDTPEQQAIVAAKVRPLCRTPAMDAQELLDALLAPGGTVAGVRNGSRAKGVEAVTQVDEACKQLEALKAAAAGDADMVAGIEQLLGQAAAVKQEVISVITTGAAPVRRK